MLFNSLILLLLSNSITSRRDKSFLYSRILITIVLISIIITYDNLSLLFLSKGIGIFGDLSHINNNIIFMYIILLTISAILLLTYFYPRKIWLKEYINLEPATSGGLMSFLLGGFIFYNILHLNLILLFLITDICFILDIIIWHGLLVGSKYIGNPSILLKYISLRTSGFYTGKGKGKAKEEIGEPEKSKSDSSSDDQYEKDLSTSVRLSLQDSKYGESSKTTQFNPKNLYGESSKASTFKKENTPVQEDDFYLMSKYLGQWKELKGEFKRSATAHNTLKIALDSKESSKQDGDGMYANKLAELRKNTDDLTVRIRNLEHELYKLGTDPNLYSDESEYDSDFSSDRSSSSDSGSSDTRPTKRTKYSDSDNKLNLILGLVTYKLNLDYIVIVRLLSLLLPAICLLIIELNIIPNITISPVNFSTEELLCIILIINSIKLIYRWKNVIINIYNSYLDKDYYIIYVNFYLSIILIILYFSRCNDIYTLCF